MSFTPTNVVEMVKGKQIGNTILPNTIISDAYDNTKTYAVGDYCIYSNILYKCNTAISTPEDFDSTKWDATTVGDELGEINSDLSDISSDLSPISITLTKGNGVTSLYGSAVKISNFVVISFNWSGSLTGSSIPIATIPQTYASLDTYYGGGTIKYNGSTTESAIYVINGSSGNILQQSTNSTITGGSCFFGLCYIIKFRN